MIISLKKKNVGLVWRYPIVGGRRLSNYWWLLVIFFGGCGFLLTGISSYFNRNLFLVIPKKEFVAPATFDNLFGQRFTVEDTIGNATQSTFSFDALLPSLPFFPQGLVLSFYGFLGLCFSFHLWFTVAWKIGAGFNEFNGKEKYVRIFRWGRPGKNRRIDFKYTNELIETIKIELFPKPALFLRVKGEKKIPLTRLGEFIPLEDLETQAAEITSLLQIPLEIEDVR